MANDLFPGLTIEEDLRVARQPAGRRGSYGGKFRGGVEDGVGRGIIEV